MDEYDPLEFLMFALKHFDIKVTAQKDNMVWLENSYIIEIEGKSLFKLKQNNQVIAPFSDVEDLCNFIKMDMKINEKN